MQTGQELIRLCKRKNDTLEERKSLLYCYWSECIDVSYKMNTWALEKHATVSKPSIPNYLIFFRKEIKKLLYSFSRDFSTYKKTFVVVNFQNTCKNDQCSCLFQSTCFPNLLGWHYGSYQLHPRLYEWHDGLTNSCRFDDNSTTRVEIAMTF